MAQKPPSTPATAALIRRKIAFVSHTYIHDSSATNYGVEAATKLSVPEERVFKTLLVEVDGALIVGIVPVNTQLDLKLLAHAAGGKKGVMADPSLAQRKTGYVVGGISPIGQKSEHPTFLDSEATKHDTVFVSGGRRGFDIELSPVDLLAVTNGQRATIARR